MRPESIRRFDLFYLASIAISLITYLWFYNTLVGEMEARTAASGMSLGSGTVIATMVVSTAVSLLLWFYVSRRRSLVAKWLIVIFFVFGLLGIPGLISGPWTLMKTLSALVLVLEAAAVYYLFRPDAKEWLAGPVAADAPEIVADD